MQLTYHQCFWRTIMIQAGTIRLDYLEIKEVKDGSGNLSAGTVKVDKTMTLAKAKVQMVLPVLMVSWLH